MPFAGLWCDQEPSDHSKLNPPGDERPRCERENGIGAALMQRDVTENIAVFLSDPGREGIGGRQELPEIGRHVHGVPVKPVNLFRAFGRNANRSESARTRTGMRIRLHRGSKARRIRVGC